MNIFPHEPFTLASQTFNEREEKLLKMCVDYGKDPFGAPNHLLMELVAKLWRVVVYFYSKEKGLS